MSDHGQPAVTPPAFVLQLAKRVKAIESQLEDLYATNKLLLGKIDANHMADLHAIGELARITKSIAKKVGAK